MNTSPVKSAWACGRNVIYLSSFFVYLFVARNVYDNYYQRHEPVVRWLCSTMLLNWPDYRGAMCVFHSLAPERIHLECLYNGPTKIAPRMHHHWHSLAAIPSHAMNEKQETSDRTKVKMIIRRNTNKREYIFGIFVCFVDGLESRSYVISSTISRWTHTPTPANTSQFSWRHIRHFWLLLWMKSERRHRHTHTHTILDMHNQIYYAHTKINKKEEEDTGTHRNAYVVCAGGFGGDDDMVVTLLVIVMTGFVIFIYLVLCAQLNNRFAKIQFRVSVSHRRQLHSDLCVYVWVCVYGLHRIPSNRCDAEWKTEKWNIFSVAKIDCVSVRNDETLLFVL